MIHRAMRVGGWVVDVLFAPKHYDTEGILGCLYDAGAREDTIRQAESLMTAEAANTGFTFSNPDRRRAVVVIGPASAGYQTMNTAVHELYHLVANVTQAAGADPYGETPAYLIGDIAMALADIICEISCKECEVRQN